MWSGSKFQSCGPIIEKEFLANEVHLIILVLLVREYSEQH